MQDLNALNLIAVWETGLGQQSVDRALTILSAVSPHQTRDSLAHLSIGRRDALLLALREQTFGPLLHSLVACPNCGEGAEFSFNAKDFALTPLGDEPEQVYAVTVNEDGRAFRLHYRLPDSLDLAAAGRCRDVGAARRELAARCVLQVEPEGLEALSDAVIDVLEAAMAEKDACADLEFDLMCPVCAHCWQAIFDIASFFWTEISAQAKRLLHEVDALARAYGWSEADILAMSATRRRHYLELVL